MSIEIDARLLKTTEEAPLLIYLPKDEIVIIVSLDDIIPAEIVDREREEIMNSEFAFMFRRD